MKLQARADRNVLTVNQHLRQVPFQILWLTSNAILNISIQLSQRFSLVCMEQLQCGICLLDP